MSRRIDIELTSARPDGSWTWRAAGAKAPKGVVDGALLPGNAKAGAIFKADAEIEMDGITIMSVTDPKAKSDKSGLLTMITNDKPFEGVTQQLAKRDRGDRPGGDRPRGDRPGGDRPRGDRPRSDRPGGDRPSGDRSRGDRPGGDRPSGDRPSGDRPRGDRPGSDRPGGDRRPREGQSDGGERRGPRPEHRGRPNFTPPPELPQRPKAKRLKPGRAHRNAVLAELPEEQRPVAERALQGGIPAVRQAVSEQNTRLKAEGKPEIPAAGLLSMAESLLPRLRVAEWLDRADAAKADLDELDLRDLRSVVASGDDPMVARDETTRALSNELKLGLAEKQEKELKLWFADIDSAIGVGRVIRALKLSSQPPKAGVRFPVELAHKLAEAATHSFNTDTISDRWSALLEATAFSPIRSQVVPTTRPDPASDDLLATVKRVAPLLPHIAALFGIVIAEGVAAPKPLRPTRPAPPAKKPAPTPRPPTSVASAAAPVTEPAPTEAVVPDAVEVEAAVVPEAVEVEAAAEPEAVEVEVAAEPEAVEVEVAAVVPEAVEVEAAAVEPEPEAVEVETAAEPEAIVPDAEAIDAPADTEAVEPASATD